MTCYQAVAASRPRSSSGSTNSAPGELQEGEVWVEYHPFLCKSPEIISLSDHIPPRIVLPAVPFNPKVPPWHPFKTRSDFEQAELFLRSDAADPLINAQLRIIHEGSQSNHNITIKSAKELHSILEKITDTELTPVVRLPLIVSSIANAKLLFKFQTANILVPFSREGMRTYAVRYREPLPVILDILEDDSLSDRLMLHPERRYISKPGGGLMRIWEEYSSGDDWWSLQVCSYGRFMNILFTIHS